MGWYRTVGRPLFFALDPESAHRLAMTLLGLPLPWRAIGGAATDLRQGVTLAGIPLRNPIGLAAGFDKSLRRLDALGRLGFGYVIGGTITREPRAGNPRPRIARDPEAGALTNAMGLPNPGLEAAARTLARTRRTAPRLVSVADEAVRDAAAVVERLAPLADGLELNASCPNVSWGRDRDQEAHLAALLGAFRERTDRPVFVKLPPFATDIEREAVLALAHISRSHGAAGLTCSNTLPVEDRRLSAGAGGRSGRPLAARTPAIVAEVVSATGGALPVNACGGIATVDDVVACLEAGATTVQLYTALVFEGPGVVGRLTDALSRVLVDRDQTVPGLVGAAAGA
ncbi:MAG TPA: dihydroorotate dehydrogenase 2 [Actinomycetota bacterium]|jgi:dihydroorotate dehydrogenase